MVRLKRQTREGTRVNNWIQKELTLCGLLKYAIAFSQEYQYKDAKV